MQRRTGGAILPTVALALVGLAWALGFVAFGFGVATTRRGDDAEVFGWLASWAGAALAGGLELVGGILGIVGIARASRELTRPGLGRSIAALVLAVIGMIGVVLLVVFGLLLAPTGFH